MKKKVLAMAMSLVTMLALVGCGGQNGAEPAATAADNSGKTVYKVGIVKFVDDASLDQIEASIQAELDLKGEELGVVFDYKDYTKNGQADASILNQIATDLIADGVDVIVPIATPAAMIMQAATEENQIPVIFSAVSDPVGAKLVASLDAPGSNITGTSDALDVPAIMNLIVIENPDIKKLGFLYDKGQDSSNAANAAAMAYCKENGIEVIEKTGTNQSEIIAAADALVAEKVDAIFTPSDNTVMTYELSVFDKFQTAKIPHYAGADSFALNGAFVGYGVNYVNLGTETADMVVEVLVNGKNPAELPVRTLADGIITINTETAEACGIATDVFANLGSEVVFVQTKESF